MTGRPLDITFTQEAKALAVHTPILVPHHWKKRVKEDLDRGATLGIIELVPTGTPTVLVFKDGSPRRTVDLQKLNEGDQSHSVPI